MGLGIGLRLVLKRVVIKNRSNNGVVNINGQDTLKLSIIYHLLSSVYLSLEVASFLLALVARIANLALLPCLLGVKLFKLLLR